MTNPNAGNQHFAKKKTPFLIDSAKLSFQKYFLGAAVLLFCICLSSCIPKSHPYPYENPDIVVKDAQKISSNLEAYIHKWLKGEVSAQIPDSLVPFEGHDRKKFFLKLPKDVDEEDMWIIRPAKPVNFDALLWGQPDPNVSYFIGASPIAPFGNKLIIEEEFPHARFFNIQVTPPVGFQGLLL